RRPVSNGVYITRLHVRYTRDKFPEDLMFQTTSNRENFQGRYILQHPFKGNLECKAGQQYQRSLPRRFEKEARNLAKLTNWDITDIRAKMNINGQQISNWWQSFFNLVGLRF
ncbi:MAG: DUF2330 domain-containing protein, partial [Cyanobacteria bacterium P01_A01_bin.45]